VLVLAFVVRVVFAQAQFNLLLGMVLGRGGEGERHTHLPVAPEHVSRASSITTLIGGSWVSLALVLAR